MAEMTEQQRKLARHALGLDGRRKMSYRNRFFAVPEESNYAQWDAMVKAGLAKMEPVRQNEGHLAFFWLTRKGAGMALNKGEKLDPEDFPKEKQA